jgi:hypothetical protein
MAASVNKCLKKYSKYSSLQKFNNGWHGLTQNLGEAPNKPPRSFGVPGSVATELMRLLYDIPPIEFKQLDDQVKY